MDSDDRAEGGDGIGPTPDEAEAERREAIEEANAAFDAQRAEDAAQGIVRKWDGTNGRTTAQVLETLRALVARTEGSR